MSRILLTSRLMDISAAVANVGGWSTESSMGHQRREGIRVVAYQHSSAYFLVKKVRSDIRKRWRLPGSTHLELFDFRLISIHKSVSTLPISGDLRRC